MRWWHRVGPGLLALFVLVAPVTARAALTVRVDGLEAALDTAWAGDDACRSVQVDDLVVRDEALVLATTTPLSVRLGHDRVGDVACSIAGWNVSALPGTPAALAPCVARVCTALAPPITDRLATALDAATTNGAHLEALVPVQWLAARPTPIAHLWLACCLATLALLFAWPIAFRRRGVGSMPTALRPLDWLGVALIVTAGVGLRVWLARHLAVQPDELVSVGYDTLWREFDGRETVMNPPLYRVLSYPVTVLTRGAPVAGRIVPVVLGAALLLVMARLGDLLAGRAGAFAACAFTAFHPGLAYATVYDRAYALLVFATALALLATVSALRTRRRADRYLVAASVCAIVLTHYFGIAVALGVVVWVALAERTHARDWLGPAALVVALCTPFAPAAWSGARAKHVTGVTAAPRAGTDSAVTGVLPSARSIAGGLAQSVPGVALGAIRPELQTRVFQDHRTSVMALATAILALGLLLGARRLRAADATGLVAVVVAPMAFTVLSALPLASNVREFQTVTSAVPAMLVLAAGVAGLAHGRNVRAGRIAAVACALALVAVHVSQRPALDTEYTRTDAAVGFVRAHTARGPVYAWDPGMPSYLNLGLMLGLSRRDTDRTTEGRDARLRALRSCSTAAVREVVPPGTRGAVTVLVVDDASCTQGALSGRGVACTPFEVRADRVASTVCTVDASDPRRPVQLPGQLPPSVIRRVDRAIPAGHEPLFVRAAGALWGPRPDAHGVSMLGIAIHVDYALYRLATADHGVVTLTVAPHFDDHDARITGTDFVVQPAEADLPEGVRATVGALKASVLATLTAERWDEVYGTLVHAPDGHTPVRLLPALAVSAVALAIVAITLLRERSVPRT